MTDLTRDRATVTPQGDSIQSLIAGVAIRRAVSHLDERGELTEIYNPAWGFSSEPLVYVYQSIIRPGKVKGWIVHREQDDRLFVSMGTLKFVLYDDRPESVTRGAINELCLGERDRALLRIPQGVFHAVQNVGSHDAMFINCPTRPYNHENPDKYRLPLDTDRIPYHNWDRPGW